MFSIYLDPRVLLFFPLALALALGVLGVSVGAIVGGILGGILSLVTAPVGGLINGARILYNKKIHEIQKRREASATNPDFWHSLPQEYQPSAPPAEEPGSLDNGLY